MLNVRRAKLDDLDVLVRLRLELLREVGDLTNDASAATVAEANRRYLSEKMPKGDFVAWIAETDSRIVGTSGLVFLQGPPEEGNVSGREAYVMNMYTTPDWRGKGVATALTREVIDFVRGTDATRIWLRTTEDGKHIYEKAGFVVRASYMELRL
jgi:GNAT superfamily N-acetyltransferase